jgi:hypothetical protein
MKPHPHIAQIVERVEERHVGLRDRFVNPFLAMGPHTSLASIWQMGMQHERECADWICHLIASQHVSQQIAINVDHGHR